MPYYGDVEFEFPISIAKNVTIIYAPNDTGKSSIFDGIIFAFYGTDSVKKLKDYINENSFEERDYKSYVSIDAEHNGKNINITRSILIKDINILNPTSAAFLDKLDIYEDGQKVHFENFQEEYFDYINAIVHKGASKYFFFDGEKINTYHIASGSDNKEAIKTILGLKEIENAQGDFGKIKNEYEKDRDIILGNISLAANIVREKQKIESEKKYLVDKIAELEFNLMITKRSIDTCEEKVKKFSDLEELINKKQKIREQKEKLQKGIEKIKNQKKDLVKHNATYILAGIIFDEIKRDNEIPNVKYFDDRLDLKIKLFLEELIKKDRCICGNKIGPKQIKEIKEYVSKNFTNDVEYFKEKEKEDAYLRINDYLHQIEKANSDYYIVYSQWCIKKKELNDIEVKFNNLENEIKAFVENSDVKDFNEDSIEALVDNINMYTQEQYKIDAEIGNLKKKLEYAQNELNEKEKELSKFANFDKKAITVEKKLRLADDVSKICNEYLEELTIYKKKEVEENATKIFMKLTNKPNRYKGLIITDNYSFKIKLADGNTQEIFQDGPKNPSTGQKKIMGLAYIAAINKSSNSIAPVIIDNPLGLFSEEHRKKVIDYLPHFGKQVIFMVTRADLSEEYRKLIIPYVNCEYDLEDNTKSAWSKTSVKSKVIY